MFPGRRPDRTTPAIVALLAVAGCLAPRLVPDAEASYLISVLFQAFLFLTLAQGWNLVAGYTGQVSLGQHAFFGTGAYVTALAWTRGFGGYLNSVTILMSGLSAALLAALVGIPLLSRLRGDYFALGTLGLGEIIRVLVIQGGSVTGGSSGLILPTASYASMSRYYYCGLALALGSICAVLAITRSRMGLALMAVRDSEIGAAASGVIILPCKIAAFSVCAFFAGLCGSLQAYYLFQVTAPGVFNLNWSLIPVIICVLGGLGTVLGPVVGTFVLVLLQESSKAWLPTIHPMLSGALVIAVVLFVPNGLLRMAGSSRQTARYGNLPAGTRNGNSWHWHRRRGPGLSLRPTKQESGIEEQT